MCSSSSAVASPMLMAVSNLSPVSTQILIMALASCEMHCPTFSKVSIRSLLYVLCLF
jgi:hypothetical protein